VPDDTKESQMAKRISVEKWIEVEVDLDDFEDDELIDALNERGIDYAPHNLNEQRQAMLRALWDNDEPRAIELLKTYLCDCLGRATI
jgi:hypothetical protein